jgi:carbamate kinase
VPVICAAGGGVPVALRDGVVAGVEAVVDTDLAASLLAWRLRADVLLLTDVAAVEAGSGTPQARSLRGHRRGAARPRAGGRLDGVQG